MKKVACIDCVYFGGFRSGKCKHATIGEIGLDPLLGTVINHAYMRDRNRDNECEYFKGNWLYRLLNHFKGGRIDI